MDDKYRIHYEVMFKNFGMMRPEPYFLPRDFDLLTRLQRDIVELEKELPNGTKLRADAKYFLLLNFFCMVLRPIVMNLPSNLGTTELLEMVREDIAYIIDAAAKKKQDEEVTGHTILEVVNDEWNQLKTNSLKVWG